MHNRLLIEVLKSELQSNYANLQINERLQEWRRMFKYITSSSGTLDLFILEQPSFWRHVLSIKINNMELIIHPGIYGPRIQYPLALELGDPSSMHKIYSIIDLCGGIRHS